MCMTQLENNQAFWLILTENKIPITVKISIYFLSPIVFKTYQSQYRSKYSIRFTQHFIESKNFEFSGISNIHYHELFASPMEVRDSGCPLYIIIKQALAWCVGISPRLCYHPRKSRKRRLGRVMKSPSWSKAVWADIAHAKFWIACPEFILIDLTEFILNDS